MSAQTLYNKIWAKHAIGGSHLYIDRHLLHEVTSPQAFSGLGLANRSLWSLGIALAIPDHAVPTRNRALGTSGIADSIVRKQVERPKENCS